MPLLCLCHEGAFRWTSHQPDLNRVSLELFGEVEGESEAVVLDFTASTDPIEDVRLFGIASLRKWTVKYWLCFGSPRWTCMPGNRITLVNGLNFTPFTYVPLLESRSCNWLVPRQILVIYRYIYSMIDTNYLKRKPPSFHEVYNRVGIWQSIVVEIKIIAKANRIIKLVTSFPDE